MWQNTPRYTLKDCGSSTALITVIPLILDNKGRIGIQKARELALAHAGLKKKKMPFSAKAKYDLDDGIYELEFTAGGNRIRIRKKKVKKTLSPEKITASDRERKR